MKSKSFKQIEAERVAIVDKFLAKLKFQLFSASEFEIEETLDPSSKWRTITIKINGGA